MLVERLRLPPLPADRSEATARDAAVVLVTSTVLLTVFFYWGRPGFYAGSGLIDWVDGRVPGALAEYRGVGGYLWWGLTSLILRVLVPLGIVVWWLRARPIEYGFRLRGIASHLPVYGGLYLVMLPILIWVSGFDSFRDFYPFYERAGEGPVPFLLYETGYLLQFVGVEAFFRGFLLFGLLPRFGWLAVPVMTVPYTMIHFSKPVPEAFAAIVAGLVLGYLAVRSKSFVPGVFLHVAVAVTMDLLVLGRAGLLGNVLAL